MKKLKAAKTSTERFFVRVVKLERKLGPIWFQLPRRGKVNAERLSEFLEVMQNEYRYAFEFREDSWFDDEVCEVLKKHNAALRRLHEYLLSS
jgi:uncharacterized protein YecE (DUF72 family)